MYCAAGPERDLVPLPVQDKQVHGHRGQHGRDTAVLPRVLRSQPVQAQRGGRRGLVDLLVGAAAYTLAVELPDNVLGRVYGLQYNNMLVNIKVVDFKRLPTLNLCPHMIRFKQNQNTWNGGWMYIGQPYLVVVLFAKVIVKKQENKVKTDNLAETSGINSFSMVLANDRGSLL